MYLLPITVNGNFKQTATKLTSVCTFVLMDANTMLGPEARDPHTRPHITGTAIIETTSNDSVSDF